MKFIARISMEFEADDEDVAEKFVLNQVKNGMRTNCVVEVAAMPDEKEQEVSSFHELLNNLNSGDMTKN